MRKLLILISLAGALVVSGMTGASSAEPSTTSGFSQRGIPQNGQTLLGAAAWSDAELDAFEDQVGGTLGVRRSYFGTNSASSAAKAASEDLAAGRLPWLSFKVPYSWSKMARGDGDAWARDIANKLGEVDGPVWVAFHHEPEGDGYIPDWVAMQRRLSPIMRQKPNIGFSIILMGWYQFFSNRSDLSMDAMWPGRQYVDVLGFDPYNWYGTSKKSTGEKKYTWDEMKWYYDAITGWLQDTGNQSVAWAVAETGYTDQAADMPRRGTAPDGRVVSERGSGADWLTRAYDDMKAAGGAALSYFNVGPNRTGEPQDFSWPITSQPKLGKYREILQRSDRLADVQPSPPDTSATVDFIGADSMADNTISASITVPAGVSDSDLCLLFVTTNTVAKVSPPSGFRIIGQQDGDGMRSSLLLGSARAGARLSVTLDQWSKTGLSLAAYSAGGISSWSSATESQQVAQHSTPGLGTSSPGGRVVSYWSDKTSSTTSWLTPSQVTRRTTGTGSGGGRISATLADEVSSGAAAPSRTATASSSNRKATMWSVALHP